jgi:hypothetical protein
VHELRPGLWHRQAPHPGWESTEPWEARSYSADDRLPFGADVYAGHKTNDTVLWLESQRAVISGDTLVDFGQGLQINERWLQSGGTCEAIASGLRPLLELPVEQCSQRTAALTTGPPSSARCPPPRPLYRAA